MAGGNISFKSFKLDRVFKVVLYIPLLETFAYNEIKKRLCISNRLNIYVNSIKKLFDFPQNFYLIVYKFLKFTLNLEIVVLL